MSDPTAIDQLSRQLVGIMGNPNTANFARTGQCLAEFWSAPVCWLWPVLGTAVICGNPPALLDEAYLRHQIQAAADAAPIAIADHQIMWLNIAPGQLALARTQPWTAIDQAHLQAIASLLAVAFAQADLQQQVEISKQSMRQIQAVADERTAQLQSSQNLLSKLQDANRRRIKQLDENNRLKDEFISTISHELRTPLTSMSLAIRMLRQPNLDETRRTKYLAIVDQQCTQEINLINDLLTLQQLESKQMSSDRQAVHLQELVQPAIDLFQATWASKQLQLQVDLPPAFSWQTESESISRIVKELLTNAGKFAEPQTIVKLQITVEQQLVLRVINQGPLISPEEQTYIFSKFRRGQGVTQQAIGGTGLGLALVKSLVQHLQGEIAVSSEIVAGSAADRQLAQTCFEILLPLGEA
jgi:signal transduction histidine kinase